MSRCSVLHKVKEFDKEEIKGTSDKEKLWKILKTDHIYRIELGVNRGRNLTNWIGKQEVNLSCKIFPNEKELKIKNFIDFFSTCL